MIKGDGWTLPQLSAYQLHHNQYKLPPKTSQTSVNGLNKPIKPATPSTYVEIIAARNISVKSVTSKKEPAKDTYTFGFEDGCALLRPFEGSP